MNTPICDFVNRYVESEMLRMHMPGHKGVGALGVESRDITEIDGADSLYEATGVIRESEKNAGNLFDAHTFYSTEGSSLCIRAMLHLVCLYARERGEKPLIAAGRNAHKSFISAAALLDFELTWLLPAQRGSSYLSCWIDALWLEQELTEMERKPTAVYLTNPDYLGNMVDVAAIAEVCHRHSVLLLVDNAHGAYLKFLPESLHPMDLGADLCCDSAHKTLPALTGSAYLHVSKQAPELFAKQAKSALALFGSTSPSYLILQSLDAVNRYLAEEYPEKLRGFLREVETLKDELRAHGYVLREQEPLKLTLATKGYGYTGREFAALLLEKGLVCEFADPDFVVLMLTPELGNDGMKRLKDTLLSVPQKTAIAERLPEFMLPEREMSVREAMFSPSEEILAAESVGRVLAVASVGCPPAVAVAVSGERIDCSAAECFAYYGMDTCVVVKKI